MISTPSLVIYACIAKGPTILAAFSSDEPGIETLASKCIDKTPTNHSMFSHTIRNRRYTFLIDETFAYFAVFDENLGKSESLWFLDRLKCSSQDLIRTKSIKVVDDLAPGSLQSQFDSVFRKIMGLDMELDLESVSPRSRSRHSTANSTKGKRVLMAPLLGRSLSALKKKKRSSLDDMTETSPIAGEKKLDMGDDHHHHHHHNHSPQKAKQVWRKHVWIVLTLDLIICTVMFGIWLWVCRGLQCIDG